MAWHLLDIKTFACIVMTKCVSLINTRDLITLSIIVFSVCTLSRILLILKCRFYWLTWIAFLHNLIFVTYMSLMRNVWWFVEHGMYLHVMAVFQLTYYELSRYSNSLHTDSNCMLFVPTAEPIDVCHRWIKVCTANATSNCLNQQRLWWYCINTF